MTVQELMDLLEDLDPEAEVRMAQQPSWPFEYSISDVMQPEPPAEEDRPNVVYLVEGSQLGYLPGYVTEDLGWR
jgi:hypothetical protein